MISAFPKIFAIGSRYTERLFNGEVEITEKVDGSQIGFGYVDGELIIRSKGSQLFLEKPEKMFGDAIETIKELIPAISDGTFYYGEYLRTPKHNVLKYSRTPKDHIALYGMLDIKTQYYYPYSKIAEEAQRLAIDVVPILYQGVVRTVEDLKSNLDRESFLGGAKIEGFVVKNYNEQLLIGGQVIPILMGKFVSEDFKEVHRKEWKSENTNKGRWDVYKSQFCNTARWHKAIQYLRDAGRLEYAPKDIGSLIARIQQDIVEEEKENIKEWLFNEFGSEIGREAIKGFPQWYKEYLLARVELMAIVDKHGEDKFNENQG